MCLALYIAADHELPIIPWDDDRRPDLHTEELVDRHAPAAQAFSMPVARYVGTHYQCGCPYNYGRDIPVGLEPEPGEEEDGDRARTALVDYVKRHRVGELFVCWEGNQAKPPTSRRTIAPDDIHQPDFVFVELELITFKHD